MRRNIFLTVALLLVSFAIQAAPITSKQAAKKANAFLYGDTKKKFSRGPITMVSPSDEIKPYYIFNIGKNEGFVIVSGDDAAYPVLGYSYKGHFDTDNVPENMKMWLEGYAKDLKKLQEMNLPAYNAPETRTHHWAEIPYLVKSQWDQIYPYNRLCPKYPGDYERRPTGCVATAMAQVMYYHKWPVEETAPIPGYKFIDEPSWGGDGSEKTEGNLEPTIFNWDAMTDIYDYYSEEESELAVAELMQYAGHSVEMMYGVDASGAYSEYIAGALMDKFGYKNTAKIVYREHYTTQDEWDELMYNELVEGRPILYSGVTKDNVGHQFVCDGYEDGFFHINWGWGAVSDGFFKLEILDPYNQGTGGAGTGMAFSEAQSAVIGIQKPLEEDNLYVNDIKAEVGGFKSLGVILNNTRKNYTSMQFDLTLPEGVSILKEKYTGKPEVYVATYRSEKKDHKVSVNKLSNGTYRFVVYSPSNSCITQLKGEILKINIALSPAMNAGKYAAKIENVLMCNTKLKGFNINGCEFNIEVAGTSILLGDADDNGLIDNNDVTAIINKIFNETPESFNFKLADVNADGIIDIEDVMLTSDIILKNAGTDRNIVSTQIDYNDALSFSPYDKDLHLLLNNNTSYKAMQFDVILPSDVTFMDNTSSTERIADFDYILKKINESTYRVLVYSLNAKNIEGNEGAILNFTTDKVAEQVQVNKIIMVTSDLRKVNLSDYEYKLPAGIEDVTLEELENNTIYTIEGLRIGGCINELKKGVYIINGKKTIIR